MIIKNKDILDSSILIVDDQSANVQLLAQLLREAGYTQVSSTTNPLEVCALHRQNNYDLVLLDLQMPVMDGFQVMEGLKTSDADDYLPVLVITAQPGHKVRALQAGAKDFICKPFVLVEVIARVHNLLEVRLLHKNLRNNNHLLKFHVRERTAELQAGYLETIFAMMRAAEYKDQDTGTHVKRISYYCGELAKFLGMDDEFVDHIYFSSPMHDIGKIGVPDHILLKPGGFSPEEWEVMKGHSVMGAKILGNSKSPYLKMGAEIALNHHERWDGGGYPNGRHGNDIPLSARIMHICDIYDTLRSKRPYKPAFDHMTAVDIITVGDGRIKPAHFDPEILLAFQQHHASLEDIYEVNSGDSRDETLNSIF